MPTPMDDSILTTIKKALGLTEDYTAFDFEIAMHINSAIATLNQLGAGPREGFAIQDKTPKWSDLLDTDTKLENIKSYIFMRVKMLFDSSSMSQQLVQAFTKMIEEESWRIQLAADPMIPQLVPEIDPDDPFGDPIILDGGGA